MRFYIRTKTKYDPSVAFDNPIVAVNVDHTQEITKIKEEARKAGKGCKITALYVARHDGSFVDLADDRTINYYNLQDGMILETTSNPFWVTTLYSNMRRREQEAASNPEDARLCFQAQKSYIRRCMAIGLLLNGTGETEKQPATFGALEDLYEYCLNQGKKPAYMSQFTLDELQEMFETFQEQYQNHRDPIGSFIYSQAVKLGYLQENNNIDDNDPFRSQYEQSGEQQRDVPARRNEQQNRNGAGGGGRRRANRNRTCDDCEVAMATSYCADCNPPLCLCDGCWRSLHRGATRRNHQMKDISEAPTPTSYTPQAYRAPFAMLVAFHRALQEIPQQLSLTAEDIKSRAQPFTDTDLEEAKQRGKPFSGFDSLENALMKHDIVLKESATIPKYSLLESGKELASKCSSFDYAVQTLLREAEVPTVPAPAVRPIALNNRQVCLLVDTEEPQKDRFVKVARERGLSAKVRKLPTGDFCWILLPPGVHADNARDNPEQELVLPYIVERKTWDDLWSSVRSPRFENQVKRMKGSGIQNLFYLVEGSPKDINGRPGPEVEAFLQGKLDRLLLEDKFFVNRTPSWLKTVEWLCHLTNLAIECQNRGDGTQWMTFAEFSRSANMALVVANAKRNPKPGGGIVWSASDFANNIKRHYRQERNLGSNLDHLPHLADSILIIQGLTAYNTNCNSHFKKALADHLTAPGQNAEECVQIHLEDITDQLVSVNVFQYYVLFLEVFKKLRIYRTETTEETQEFLSRFGAKEIKGDQRAGGADDNLNHKPDTQAIQRVDNMMFANDSQEEEFMLNQALQQSLADADGMTHGHDDDNVGQHSDGLDNDNDVHNGDDDDNDGDGGSGDNNGNGCGGGGGDGDGDDNGGDDNDAGGDGDDDDGEDDDDGAGGGAGADTGAEQNATPIVSKQSSFNQDQKDVKPPKSKSHEDQKNNSNGRGNPQEGTGSNKVTVKQEVEEEENYLESILQFKIYDSLTSHFEDAKNENPESKQDSEDEEQLRKILEESKLQYEKEEKERKALLRSVYNEEEELRKAIELSTKEMEEKRKEGMGSPKGKISDSEVIKNTMISKMENTSDYRNGDNVDVDDELYKVLELSKKEVKQNKVNGNKQRGKFLGNPRKDSIVKSRNNSNVGVRNGNDSDDELKKVIELSLRDTEHSEWQQNRPKKATKLLPGELDRTSRINCVSSCSDAEQLKKVLELSKKESQQKQEEIYQVNESQEDELEDYYDLEVPDFVSSEVSSNGVNDQISKKDDTLISTSSLSRCQNNARKGVNTDRICSSLSAASSTSCQQKPSTTTAVEKLQKDIINENETVFVDSQDMDEEEDAVVERFNKTFGKIASGKQAGEHHDSFATDDDDDDAILVDNEDVEEDQNIIKNIQSRLQDKGARKCTLNGMNDYQNNSPTSFIDDAIFINSQDEDANENMARKLQKRYDNDAILVDSQDVDGNESTAQKLQERYDKEGSSGHQSSSYADDAILLDSQDDIEVENTNSDYEIALQLQKEFNKQANNTNINHRRSSTSFTSTSNNFVRESANNQIVSYREEQKKRFKEAKTGKSPKTMSPGLAFRQRAEAIARGKESLLAVVRPLGSAESTPRRRPDKRSHDGTIKTQVEINTPLRGRKARKSCPTSTHVHTETRTTPATMDPSDACLVFPSSSSRPQEYQPRSRKQGSSVSSSNSSSLVFPGSRSSGGCDQQSTPGGSFSFPSSSCPSRGLSTSHRSDSSNGFVFPGSAEFSSSPSPRPSRDTLASNASQSNSTSDDGINGSGSSAIINGPKCSECGQTGHRKGTKRCPYYYTEEAQRKREELSRKRKEKREEEERQFQTSIDAVTAEQLRMAEQAEQLRRQVEEFNRQNNNLPKVVEDAMKYLKKRRRK